MQSPWVTESPPRPDTSSAPETPTGAQGGKRGQLLHGATRGLRPSRVSERGGLGSAPLQGIELRETNISEPLCRVVCSRCRTDAASVEGLMVSPWGRRGIWSAALNGDLGRVKYLIQKATDPSQPDSAGYTALHYASRNGHYAVCQFLLESGAKCDAQTHGGATALHRASYCGHTEIARLLLSHGSNPRLVDDDGMTSLHKAAEKGHVDICSLLLQHSPTLKAVRDRKARLASDLLPCNSDLRDLLAS